MMRWAAFVSVAALVACSSGGSGSPNKIPGQCVLSNGIWYCGVGYGNLPQCPSQLTGYGQPCDYDGGTCFDCYYSPAGATFACVPGDAGEDGPRVWGGAPSGTGCSQ
jgi:hypothetical protein